jgi:TP901-1 family phage major tail protein
MAMSGTEVLLYVNTGTETAPVWTVIGSQRSLSREETTEEIDVSTKDSRAGRYLPGRYGSTVSLEALYVPDDTAYQLLKAAMRAGERVQVQVWEQGIAVEEADAIVTSISEEYPDQAEATISVDLRIDGEWREVGS